MKTTITDTVKQRVKDLHALKMTVKEIAGMTNLSRRSVGRILVEAGLAGTPIVNMKALVAILEQYDLATPDKLYAGIAKIKDSASVGNAMKIMSNLDEPLYAAALKDIIHLREARKHNSSVTNAMRQLANKASNHGDS